MGVTNISTVSQITVMYSNSSGASIVFDLLQALTPTDERVLETVAVTEDMHVYNLINTTVAGMISLMFNEITEEAREILAKAFETQDDSGIVSALMPKSNKMRIWKLAVPTKNAIYTQDFPQSIITKQVEVAFSCKRSEDKLLSA